MDDIRLYQILGMGVGGFKQVDGVVSCILASISPARQCDGCQVWWGNVFFKCTGFPKDNSVRKNNWNQIFQLGSTWFAYTFSLLRSIYALRFMMVADVDLWE